jgi:uncharacterized protein (TIGR02594 family)
MVRILLAVIVALCAFASPSLADTKARSFLKEGRSALNTNVDRKDRKDRKHDGFGGSRSAEVIKLAERYIGTNPTKMRSLWCANFLGMIEKKAGRPGSGSNFARSYATYGKKVSKPQPGDIAVMARGKRGGHVGYFVGWAPNGKAIVISGNSRGGKVSKGQYAASRIFAWRRPA